MTSGRVITKRDDLGPAVATEPIERFWAYVGLQPTDRCWSWRGPIDDNGYGLFWSGSTRTRAHRFAYELAIGPIPEGLTIDHTCHTSECDSPGTDCPHRRCVNPGHLEPVTQRENTLRGQTVVAAHAAKTHCPQGHAYDEKNTHINRAGSRVCRACDLVRTHRKRGKVVA